MNPMAAPSPESRIPGIEWGRMRLLFHRPVRPLPGDRHLTIEVSHGAPRTVLLLLRFHTDARADPLNDPRAGRMIVAMFPHIRARVCVDLGYLETARAHHHRQPGVGIIVNAGPVVRIADIRSVTGLAHRPPPGLRFRLRELSLDRIARAPRVMAPAHALVDPLGQLVPRRFPGKAVRLGPEIPAPHSSVTILPSARPARGRFTIDRDRGRHWIVTPSGERLFSVGMNCVSPHAAGPVTGMRGLFRRLPSARGPASAAVHGDAVSLYTANLIGRYGAAWRTRWARLAVSRLKGWGFNTIGNWSDELAWRERKLYYTMNAAWWDEPKRGDDWGLYGGFPDVFSPDFSRKCDERARAGARPDDPLLIGYFLLNEPQWQRTDVHLAAEVLRTQRAPATRTFLLSWLCRRHGGGTARPSAVELDRMRDLMVDRYFETVCNAMRRHDPHHLLLGVRFYGVPPRFLLSPMRRMDVVSVNTYATQPDPEIMRTLHQATGRPVLLGEFHLGATDRGPTSHGLVGVANQHERGIGYARYLERAAAIPYCVGAHWFQHVDQPVLGRFDGENYNIGFVDVTDTPYPDLTAAAAAANQRVPFIHAGSAQPRTRPPRLDPTGLIW